MAWPLSQEYNEAIQSPESSFSDPELKKGEVVCNALGIPLPRSGNFADVYEFRCANGTRWAIKCFTRQVDGLRERYQEISRALQEAKLPFTVEFTYQQDGILIRGQWYPILKMQWVEGFTFNEFVRQNLDKGAMLEGLLQIWGRMSQRLRAAGIAHADLQHGNVLLVQGSTANSLAVKLIDYDGMFVPTLAGRPSGEVGHPSYQHPQRVRDGLYSAEVDRFPLLLIATALRCIRVGGRALWDRHDNGDNLLFREIDLKEPDRSRLFEELNGLGDGKARALVGQVRQALAGAFDRVPLLDEVLPELASGLATAPTKPPRSAPPATVQPLASEAIATAPKPSRSIPSAAVTSGILACAAARADAGIEDVDVIEDDDDVEDIVEPGPRDKRRRRKKKKQVLLPVKTLWIAGGIGAGVLLLIGVVSAVFLFGGRSKPALDANQQASVQIPDKDNGVSGPKMPPKESKKTEPKDAGKDTQKDPIVLTPLRDPPKEPVPDPVIPVQAEGVFRLRHTLASSSARAVAVSANGKQMLTWSKGDGTINTWDLETGAMKEVKTPYSVVVGAAFLPGNKSIFCGTNDGKLHRWSLPKTAQDQAAAPWTQLFNGKDLTGWKIHPDEKTQWSVKDGILVGEAPMGLLFTERGDYTNFHFRVEAMINEGGDSGLFFRVPFRPCRPATETVPGAVPAAYEAQILGVPGRAGGHTGSLFIYNSKLPLEERTKLIQEPLIKPNEWFTYEVIANGNHIVLKVNGKTTVDWVDTLNSFRKGHLAIQQSGPKDIISIRKAEVLELPDDVSGEGEPFEPVNNVGNPWSLNAVDVSADGKFALAGGTGRVLAWSLDTGRILPGKWPVHGYTVESMSLAANARFVVTNYTGNGGAVWNIDSGSEALFFRVSTIIVSAISPDGNLVVSGNQSGDLTVHDVPTGRRFVRVLGKTGGQITALAISANGRYLAAAVNLKASKILAIYDMNTGNELQRFDNVSVIPGQLKFATGRTCLVAAGMDGKLRVFDTGNGIPDPIGRTPEPMRNADPKPSPDPVHNPATGTSMLVDIGNFNLPGIRWLSMVKDGQAVTIHIEGSIRLWSITKDKLEMIKEWQDPDKMSVIASAAGHHTVLMAAKTGLLATFNLETSERRVLAQLDASAVRGTDVNRDDSLAVASATIQNHEEVIVFDLKTNKEISRIPMPARIQCVRFVSDGESLLTAGEDGCLNLWESRTGKLIRKLWQIQGQIKNLVVPSDGRQALVVDQLGRVRAIDIATGRELYELQKPPLCTTAGISISPSGRVGVIGLLPSKQTQFLFFDVANGHRLSIADSGIKEWPAVFQLADDEHFLNVMNPPQKLQGFAIRQEKSGPK